MAKCVNVCINERVCSVLCNPGDLDLKVGDFCVVSCNGRETTGFVQGFVHAAAEPESAAGKAEALPTVSRRASPHEVRAWHFLKRRESEAIALCKEKAAKHGLEMKVSNVEFDDRQRKVIFHFTADKRVDFRELVKDLAATFHARIELWQIGVRDEAKRMSGIGLCGCPLCCAAWMKDFAPVSIRCAKAQDLQFSPTRLSGICGRLRCCLAYEHEQYVEMGKDVPTVGSIVDTEKYGECKVVERNLLSRTLSIADVKGQNRTISVSEVKRVAKRTGGDKQGPLEWQAMAEEDSEEAASLLIRDEEESDARAIAMTQERGPERPADRGQAVESAGAQPPPTPETASGGEEKPRSRRRRRGRRRPQGDEAQAQTHSETPPSRGAPAADKSPGDDGARKNRRGGRRGRRSRKKAGGEVQPSAAE